MARWHLNALKRSPWIYHVPTGACNNCDIELLACLTPRFDVERFGIVLVGSPRHADALVVTGVVTRQAKPRLIEVYRQTPRPCVVFAMGMCSSTGALFEESYTFAGPVDEVLREVDPDARVIYIPGCPPKPEAIISGVVKGLSSL